MQPFLASGAAPGGSMRLGERGTKRLLVVDDLPQVLELVRGLVRRVADVRVRVESELSGARALRRLADEPFDAVLSDQRLLDGDGLAVLEGARRLRPDARRILMTGYHEIHAPLERVRAAQVDAYLPKPFPAMETVRLLDSVLRGEPATLGAHRARARSLEARAAERGTALLLPSRVPGVEWADGPPRDDGA